MDSNPLIICVIGINPSISTLQRNKLKLLIARGKAEVVDPQEYVIAMRLLPLKA